MAKDDYSVIVYKILKYLYARLKKGEPIVSEMLMYDGPLFNINRSYWVYVWSNLSEQGYITGLRNIKVAEGNYIKDQLSGCEITPKGIEYLSENSVMKKIEDRLKEVVDVITPFV